MLPNIVKVFFKINLSQLCLRAILGRGVGEQKETEAEFATKNKRQVSGSENQWVQMISNIKVSVVL